MESVYTEASRTFGSALHHGTEPACQRYRHSENPGPSRGSSKIRSTRHAADAAHFRGVIASCVSNNVDAGVFRQGLHDLTNLWS
jgi:hypothetical protein